MDPELRQRLEALEKKVDETYKAADRTRKYIMWIGIVSVLVIVLPAIGLVFEIPTFINTYAQIGNIQ